MFTRATQRAKIIKNPVISNFTRKYTSSRVPKPPLYKRKSLWIGSTLVVGGISFITYEMNPDGTFGPRTVCII